MCETLDIHQFSPNVIARGSLVHITGGIGKGKTTLAMDLANALTGNKSEAITVISSKYGDVKDLVTYKTEVVVFDEYWMQLEKFMDTLASRPPVTIILVTEFFGYAPKRFRAHADYLFLLESPSQWDDFPRHFPKSTLEALLSHIHAYEALVCTRKEAGTYYYYKADHSPVDTTVKRSRPDPRL